MTLDKFVGIGLFGKACVEWIYNYHFPTIAKGVIRPFHGTHNSVDEATLPSYNMKGGVVNVPNIVGYSGYRQSMGKVTTKLWTK